MQYNKIMDYSQLTPEQALRETASSANGLTAAEAERRLAAYGPNQIPDQVSVPLWRRIIEPFSSLFVMVLLGAALISVFNHELLDAMVMTAVLMVNAVIYYLQQYSAGRVLASLKNRDKRLVQVLRDGRLLSVEVMHIVPGDIVLLAEGLKVPADGRILAAHQLRIDESILTGESVTQSKAVPALKDTHPLYEQTNMVFSGTLVRSGAGEFLVTATGRETELGRIAELSESKTETGPLQLQIDRLTRQIMLVIAVVLVLIFALALYRGMALAEAVRFLLSLAVSAIPEGLPVALTLVLLLSAQRLMQRQTLVRRLAAIETLGHVQLIATDKTGTITYNELKIAHYAPYLVADDDFRRYVRQSLAVHRGHSDDPLEIAIRDAIPSDVVGDQQARLTLPFQQSARMSGAIWERNHRLAVYVKGAPETILERSDLTTAELKRLHQQIADLSAQRYRLIGFGYRSVAASEVDLEHIHGLTFVGFIALADGLRRGVPSAVANAKAAGIEIVMLTGDNPATATAIGRAAGILSPHEQAQLGTSVESLSPADLRATLSRTHAFARVLPEHKYAILDAYRGHLVTAMTGDGVNDVPALVKADVGIAVGRGSDAAKEAADLIILNNNFATIVEAVRQGRTILANVRKMLLYLFATSIGEVLVMTSALLLGLPLPVTPVQILWINMVTDGFAVIPLGLEPPEDKHMKIPPAGSDASLLSRSQVVRIGMSAVAMAVVVLSVFVWYRAHNTTLAVTMAFSVLAVIQWANALIMRSDHQAPWHWRRPNWLLFGSLSVAVVVQATLLFTPLRTVFDAELLGFGDVMILLAAFLVALVLGEAARRITVSR